MFGPLATLEDIKTHFALMAAAQCEEPGLSELDHALQCAAALKATAPEDEELQIAGLLHDVASGHCSESAHGEIGGRAVRELFGQRIGELVRLHVSAKRYLVATDPQYRANLSRVSTHTLVLQGGAMMPQELALFESEPYWRAALTLRRADEAAKKVGRAVPGVDAWLPLLQRVTARRMNATD